MLWDEPIILLRTWPNARDWECCQGSTVRKWNNAKATGKGQDRSAVNGGAMTEEAAMTQLNAFQGMAIFAEIQEFTSLSVEAQYYIRRSLDIARGDQPSIERWTRDSHARSAIHAQIQLYRRLDELRAMLGECRPTGDGALLSLLIELTSFDLGSGDLDGFGAYRFLYERLLGGRARDWLPSAFCAAAMMPHVRPMRRIALLRSLSEAAVARWVDTEPRFFPKQIAA